MLSTNRFCSRLYYKTFSSWTLCQYTQVQHDTKDNFSEYFIHYLQILPFHSQKERYSLSLSLSHSLAFCILFSLFISQNYRVFHTYHPQNLLLVSYTLSSKRLLNTCFLISVKLLKLFFTQFVKDSSTVNSNWKVNFNVSLYIE